MTPQRVGRLILERDPVKEQSELKFPLPDEAADTLDIAADRLSGAKEIAKFLGITPRRAVYLLDRGSLPAGKEGRTWVASRQALREHYRRMTGA